MNGTSSSSLDIDDGPEVKRFRVDVNTQVSVDAPSGSSSSSGATPVAGEASQEGQSPAAPSSASYRSSNGSVISSSDSPIKEEYIESTDLLNEESEGSTVGGASTTTSSATATAVGGGGGQCDLLDILSKTMLSNVFAKVEESMSRPSTLLNSIPSSPNSQQASVLPGALAVAQTPAAQLFAEDDWSWHRNPAASIRSGGTNKQTPVWKYFVYNKAENLSRCIVGDCTYMLKGPHTSTLACHLKKHTKEYSEFQKLKSEYSRTKMEIQANQPKEQSQSPAASIPVDQPVKPPKIRKEPSVPKLNNMSFLVSAFRSNNNTINSEQSMSNAAISSQAAAAAATPQVVANANAMTSVPALMQNMMMNMNPLQMMLAHSLPTTSATNGLGALHNGLSLVNGQLIQSKKWRKDEKKQRDLQTKLALALATSHIPIDVLQNPIWREMFDVAQPKFTFCTESLSYDHIISSFSSRLFQSMRTLLTGTRKLNILVDASRIADVAKITVAVALPAGLCNSYETNVMLLGWKNLQNAENMAEEMAKTIDQVLADYNIEMDSINRILYSGFQNFVDEDCSSIMDRQIESFGSRLSSCLHHWLDHSHHVDNLKKSVFTMIFSVITNPAALQLATKLNAGRFEIPISEPFPILAETILGMRDAFQLNQVDGFVGMTDAQWTRLLAIHHICNMFKPFIAYTSEMTTIDTVIPTIQQIQHQLKKDIYQLGEGAQELADLLANRTAFVTDPDHEDFVPAYIQATALNPQLAVTLNQEQMKTARCLIEEEVSKRNQQRRATEGYGHAKKLAIGVDSILANVMKGAAGEACDSLSIYNDLFQNMTKMEKDESKENLVNQYFDEIASMTGVESMFNPLLRTFGNPLQAPLAYWKSCSSKCESLSDYAAELLSIPIFTLTTDRIVTFSPNPSPFAAPTSSMISWIGASNAENCDQLEKQLIMRFNKSLMAKLF